jgi:hypothetical protein
MKSPLVLTIDLDQLGLGASEEGQPSIQELVIDAAAAKLLASVEDITRDFRQRYQAILHEELRAAVAEQVRIAMRMPIQKSTPWSEAVGDPVTIRELIRVEIQQFLNAKPRGARRSSTDKTPANLEEMIAEAVGVSLRGEFAQAIAETRQAVTERVTELALAAAQELINKK